MAADRSVNRKKLESALAARGVPGTVYYSRRWQMGWMHVMPGGSPQRLGYNVKQALELINHGTMDFMRPAAKS